MTLRPAAQIIVPASTLGVIIALTCRVPCAVGQTEAAPTAITGTGGVPGARILRKNEFDLYGPRPFPEQISHMGDDMVAQILGRQEPNGSWIDRARRQVDGAAENPDARDRAQPHDPRKDIKAPEMNVVIARISDYGKRNAKGKTWSGWAAIRAAQEKVVADDPRGALVNVDDCNAPSC